MVLPLAWEHMLDVYAGMDRSWNKSNRRLCISCENLIYLVHGNLLLRFLVLCVRAPYKTVLCRFHDRNGV
jgi:hypothetical protein